MNWKYIIAGLFALFYIAYLFLRPQEGTQLQGRINLSYDICLDTIAGYQVLDDAVTVRNRYTEPFWVDSTSQYFSKIVTSPSADTFFVSAFNNATFKSVNEAMEAAGFETLARRIEQSGNFRYQFLFSRMGPDTYFNRLLVTDPQFGAVTLIDQVGTDSSALRQQYETQTFTKYIKECL